MATNLFPDTNYLPPLAETVPDERAPMTVPLWRDRFWWMTLLLTLFAIAPFLLPGYFWGANDARHHVYFLFEYNRSVQDGIWWPRWSPDFAFGYGYPFFNIYGPLSHFLAELLLHFLHFDYTVAIESVFVLSILGSAAAMYLYIRSWQGTAAAVVAALVYLYIPYHLLNLYVRANLAESMAFVWLPLCLWTVRQGVLRPAYRWYAGAAVSYAGLLVTSNLIFVLFTPLLALYLLCLGLVYSRPSFSLGLLDRVVRWPWLRSALLPAAGLATGIALAANFLLPLLLERQYVRTDQWFDGRYDFRGHFVYWNQLFSPLWGFGTSEIGPDDGVGFQLGLAPLLLAGLGILLIWPLVRKQRWEIGCFVLTGLVATFVALQWGAPLWELPIIGQILAFAQFPWRWFAITALALSVLSGLVVHHLLVPSASRAGLPLLGLVAVILLSSYPYLQVQIQEPAEGPVSLAGLMRFQQSSDEMTGSTAWVDEIPTWSDMADTYINQAQAGEPVTPVSTNVDYKALNYELLGVGSVAHNTIMEEVFFCTGKKEGVCHPRDDQRIIFNRFYYPGWRAYLLDGEHGQPIQELPIEPELTGSLGRITVPVPPVAQGFILLRFEDTWPRTAGKVISLTTIAFLCVLGFWCAYRRWRTTAHGP
ncbi:MAG: hypothetical protein KF832_23540 [Caldilineaceae bacterium]|nr:hypothetical protein [Caldilineaceae bacterium]